MKLNTIQAGEYFTLDEAAEMLGKCRDTVIYAVTKQVVQPVVVGRMVLLSAEHIQKLKGHFNRRKPYTRRSDTEKGTASILQEGGE